MTRPGDVPTMLTMRASLTPMVVAMALGVGGCGLSTTPFDPAMSCQAVGGTYSGGQCRAGSASIERDRATAPVGG